MDETPKVTPEQAVPPVEPELRQNPPINGDDPALLLVKGKNGENKPYIKSLSHAIVTVITKYGYANLKCVGASAVNNGMKAITIASGEAKKRGVNLVVSPSFTDAVFNDIEKTGMMLTVFNRGL